MRLWFGSAGMVATMHYDTSYNTHTVLYGAKHIIVAPPKDFDKVYIHPAVHPSHRQSQILNMTHPDLERFPEAAKMSAQETVLRPGETIYVPPYWLHSVRSVTTTIAISIWTESPEGRLAGQTCAVPFALANCPRMFMPLWEALDEIKSPKKEEYVIGGAMHWYRRRRSLVLQTNKSRCCDCILLGLAEIHHKHIYNTTQCNFTSNINTHL
eukprot:COSAG05_NODE_1337_length_5147_cov_25.636485_5_plen_211_part_00